MAKKFFHDNVYNKKRHYINIVIIAACVIGIVLCFILTSDFEGENHNTPESYLSIKGEVTVELNSPVSKEMFFEKYENIDLSKVEIVYPKTITTDQVGKFTVVLKVDGQDYKTKLIVVDTTKPKLELKNITLQSTKLYQAADFVTSCTDNSNTQCKISFYKNGLDENGKNIDYSKYSKDGIYSIKIVAEDASGNKSIKETKLIINPKNQNNTVTCKYGNTKYDKNAHVIAFDISSNACSVNPQAYNNEAINKELTKIMEVESIIIESDVNNLNLEWKLTINRKISAVKNETGKGLIGYELRFSVIITNDNKNSTVADYKIDVDGNRIFNVNPYKIGK